MMSDFAFSKKEKSRGVYGKRTTLYNNYQFDVPKDKKFYDEEVYYYDKDVYDRDDSFWDENRLEKLNKDDVGVLLNVRHFKNGYKV